VKSETLEFLAWAAPRLGLDAAGFERVHGVVRKRMGRRMRELHITELGEYRRRLEGDADEWPVLAAMCRIPVSRFHRDAVVFDPFLRMLLPARVEAARREGRPFRVWSAGCASGEEPYTFALLWSSGRIPHQPGDRLEIVATDADEIMLQRARRAVYEEGSLRELPPVLREQLEPVDGGLRVPADVRSLVDLHQEDLRETMREGPFDLIACRNLAFTYFDARTRLRVAEGLRDRLDDGGILLIGRGETLPPEVVGVSSVGPGIHQLTGGWREIRG
jgi:chemotaxis protein methyltransferase CheR